jgi:D-glycero-D-manno-heptose 1,7-bisphosphate phosphatase
MVPDATRQPAAFIDRDGVINEEREYVHRPEDFHVLPGVIHGLRRLQEDGYVLVVVTNQAGIARGLYSEADFQRLTDHMRSVLSAQGVQLAAVYHCPHHPTAGQGVWRTACECRKPAPGMLIAAANTLKLSLKASVLVGDKRSDIEAGRRAGVAACVLVQSGHAIDPCDAALADACVADLRAAAEWVHSNRPGRN